LIHPSAIIHENVEIGDNPEIMELCVIGALPIVYRNWTRIPAPYGVQIGDNVHLHSSAHICSGTERATKLGNNVILGQMTIIGHDVIVGNRVMIINTCSISGWVEIGDDVVIGPNTTIRNRVKIGSNVIIGMGSNVTKDIPSNSLAYGNPCKVIKTLGPGLPAKNLVRLALKRMSLT